MLYQAGGYARGRPSSSRNSARLSTLPSPEITLPREHGALSLCRGYNRRCLRAHHVHRSISAHLRSSPGKAWPLPFSPTLPTCAPPAFCTTIAGQRSTDQFYRDPEIPSRDRVKLRHYIRVYIRVCMYVRVDLADPLRNFRYHDTTTRRRPIGIIPLLKYGI